MRGHVHHSGGRCTNFCSDSSPSRPDCDAAGRLETFPFSPLLSLRLPLLPLCIKQLAATSPRILGKKFFRKTKCAKILRKIQHLRQRSCQKWSLSLHTYGIPLFSIWKFAFETKKSILEDIYVPIWWRLVMLATDLIMGPILPKRKFFDVYDARQAASHGNPAAASNKDQKRKQQQPDVVYFYRQNKAHNLSLSHLLSQDFIRILSPFFCLPAEDADWPPLVIFLFFCQSRVWSCEYPWDPHWWTVTTNARCVLSRSGWIFRCVDPVWNCPHIWGFSHFFFLIGYHLIIKCDMFWSRWMQHWKIS